MKLISKTLAVAIIATTPFVGAPLTAQAGESLSAEVNRINYDGFHRCKELRNRGYKASASGTSIDGVGYGNASFRVSTCFKSRARCQRFIDRIYHHISSIDRLHHARCSRY